MRGAAALLLALALAALGAGGALPSAAAAGGDGGSGAGGAPAPPAADCAEEVVARVQEHYDGARDLAGRFEQETRSVAFPEPQISAGRVELAKPGRMRWEYSEPQPSLVVSDGSTLWIVDPEAREVQVMAVEAGFLSGTAMQFLIGGGRLTEAFQVSALACGETEATLRLDPREPASYERLELRVERASGGVRGTQITDLLGNRTRVEFHELELNRDPGPERFRYEPAADERVLELRP